MIKYAHTSDYVTMDTDTMEATMRYIPESMMFGTENDVEWEDHDFEETNAMIHDISASVAYALRMSL